MVVLVVEDEAIIAFCAVAILEEAGFAVLGPAHTSGEALALSRGKRPDVALVDIDLETSGAGIGVAQQLHAQYGTAIVFTTGRLDEATKHRDVAVAVLSKPYDPSELPGIVKYAASRPRGLASTRSNARHFGQVTSPSRDAGVAVPETAVVPR
jgi:DNA-binding response OmpR family regulator